MTMAPPVAQTAMLIRRPMADVYEAIVDPAITAKFWFTKGSNRLDSSELVTWEWEMYGATAKVRVLEIEANARILMDWGDLDTDPGTRVEWIFTELDPERTFIDVSDRNFTGTDDEQIAKALDSTGGFALVLAGLKAWLEHGLQLNLVGDRFPADATSH
ncbi:MAG: SRPBCC family protein [Thermomicrobiales bacterium]